MACITGDRISNPAAVQPNLRPPNRMEPGTGSAFSPVPALIPLCDFIVKDGDGLNGFQFLLSRFQALLKGERVTTWLISLRQHYLWALGRQSTTFAPRELCYVGL
jgi:hypothetical protein